METQKHLFDIPEDVTYLNTAGMSPLLRSTNEAGKKAIDKKSNPFTIKRDDYFNPLNKLRSLFAKLIDTDEPQRIAAIPAASYGIATVTNNIVLNEGDEILIIENQFPSNVYSWKRLAEKYNANIKIVKKPENGKEKGKRWNTEILNNITNKTSVVSMGNIHWTDGTIFNLKAISKKVKLNQALLIIDGSQSIGALPFSVKDIKPDALICPSYKWLFGSYSYGLAYYGPYFDHGIPIEESWTNRLNNHTSLTDYPSEYKVLSNRYNVGENGNFIAIPMLLDSISHILKWNPANIQDYCHSISSHIMEPLLQIGCEIEDFEYRAKHLFGIRLPEQTNIESLKLSLDETKIFVSIIGSYIRVSCHLFNTREDFDNLLDCITKAL